VEAMEEAMEEATKVIKKTTILKVSLMMLLSAKNPTSSGRMSQASRTPRTHSKKLSFCPSDSNKFSQEVENLGKESCSTVLQEQERPILLKLVQLKLKEHSSRFLLQIS
jgi:hypothetical protein